MSGIGKYVVVAAALISTGCRSFSGPDCIDETRGLALTARLTSIAPAPLPADTGTAHLSLSEARNFDSKRTTYQNIGWFVGSGLVRSGVTAIHVHEQSTGRILFEVPLDPGAAPPYVITQASQPQPYRGALRWEELYELLGSGRGYVDVHTDDPNRQLRGTLTPVYPNWRDFTHAYCS